MDKLLGNGVLAVLDDHCPACGGNLDTGFECNSCDFDGLPLILLREACELRGERMHPSGLYMSEMNARTIQGSSTE